MSELSIFVDESGDFGKYDYHCPYYIIALVFHNQDIDISDEIKRFDQSLIDLGYNDYIIHTEPIIRGEGDYQNCSIDDRKKLLKRTMSFVRHLDIKCQTFVVEKKHIDDSMGITARLSKEVSRFVREQETELSGFDKIKIYYDNGQTEVTKILTSVFVSRLDNVEYKKVIPSDYRLFQVADFICTMQLIDLKRQLHINSKSEKILFVDERTFVKNYLKPIEKKMWN